MMMLILLSLQSILLILLIRLSKKIFLMLKSCISSRLQVFVSNPIYLPILYILRIFIIRDDDLCLLASPRATWNIIYSCSLSYAVHNALSWVTCTCDIPRLRGDTTYIAYEWRELIFHICKIWCARRLRALSAVPVMNTHEMGNSFFVNSRLLPRYSQQNVSSAKLL